MADLHLRFVPDPVLRAVCTPVTVFDAALTALAEDMLTVMYAAPGRGLAAPQVGIAKRIFVMDATWKDGTPAPQVFVNPEMVKCSDAVAVLTEGCLSIPDQTSRISRPAEVTLRWQDLNGASHTGTFTDFSAACVQHERDHLDGVLCTDYPEAP
ncbi:MAG: peptide deformylase [Yoonia sp.]